MKSKVMKVKGSQEKTKENPELERELFESGKKKAKTMLDRGMLPMGSAPGLGIK